MSEIRLTSAQARVLGSLVEKENTTLEYYPLSLNALANACNQRSNRDPVMNLDEDDLRLALRVLEDLHLAGRARSSDGRVTKYEHWLGEAYNFTRAETALLCVLLLRGPQTPGELRGRTERLHRFEEIGDVLGGLDKLRQREPALVAVLPRQPGAREARYVQLLSSGVEEWAASAPAETHTDEAQPVRSGGSDNERMTNLEAEVQELRQQLKALRTRFDDLFPD